MNRLAVSILLFGLLSPHASLLTAADPTPDTVAAYVGVEYVTVGEIEREMAAASVGKELSEDEAELLQAQTLGLLVNRQMVLHFLTREKLGATEQDVATAIAQLQVELKSQGKTLAEQLKKLGMTELELRRAYSWQIGWPKYLSTRLLKENIEAFFQKHKRDFDGTKLKVSHILFKVSDPQDEAAVIAAKEKADKVLLAIKAKSITFAEAAKQNSEAPTAEQGGDIGLISRHEPMPPPFNDAAFLLKPGETSPPTFTSFGVHLIHCLAEEPGKLTLADPAVDQTVREEAIRYIFMKIVEQERPKLKVDYTGAVPYFDPVTQQLTKPQPAK